MGKGTERFYMNKLFGRGLEQARALEQQMMETQKPGAIVRALIEPDQEGGEHRVVIEKQTMAGQRGQGTGDPIRSTEHMFGQIEDAIRFLDDVLHGRTPGEAGSKDGNSDKSGNATAASANEGTQGEGEAEDFSGGLEPGGTGGEW